MNTSNLKTIPRDIILPVALEKIKNQAWTGLFGGTGSIYDQMYLMESRWYLPKFELLITFTRDSGHHSGGWFKNPDYERCWHLSISFFGGRKPAVIQKIIDGLYGEHKKWIWSEPPYTKEAKKVEVWHYRLFCDENWQPIKPRGEVYNKEFTERGWKSFSEIQHELKKNQKD